MNDESHGSSCNRETLTDAASTRLPIFLPVLAILIGILLFQNLRTSESEEFVGKQFDYDSASSTGESINKEALLGSVVVVNFWATHCPSCLEDITHLKDLLEELRHDDFRIVGINLNRQENLDEFFQFRESLPWPSLYGSDAVSLGEMYKVSKIPRVMLLDRKGTIVADARGIDDIKAHVLRLVHGG